MTTVFSNARVDDETRRSRLYDGQVFVYSATPASRESRRCESSQSQVA